MRLRASRRPSFRGRTLREPGVESGAGGAVVQPGQVRGGAGDVDLEAPGLVAGRLRGVLDVTLPLAVRRQREFQLLPRRLECALVVAGAAQRLVGLLVRDPGRLDLLLLRRQFGVELLEARVRVPAMAAQLAVLRLDLGQFAFDLAAAVPDAVDQLAEAHGLDLRGVGLVAQPLHLAPGRLLGLLRLAQRGLDPRHGAGRLLDDQPLRADLLVEVLDLEPTGQQAGLRVVGGEEAHAVARHHVAGLQDELSARRQLLARGQRRGEVRGDVGVREPVRQHRGQRGVVPADEVAEAAESGQVPAVAHHGRVRGIEGDARRRGVGGEAADDVEPADLDALHALAQHALERRFPAGFDGQLAEQARQPLEALAAQPGIELLVGLDARLHLLQRRQPRLQARQRLGLLHARVDLARALRRCCRRPAARRAAALRWRRPDRSPAGRPAPSGRPGAPHRGCRSTPSLRSAGRAAARARTS